MIRVNAEIEMAEFEIGLRDLLSNVENAYWDVYFAYRDLQVKLQARNDALYVLNYGKTHGDRAGLGAGREDRIEVRDGDQGLIDESEQDSLDGIGAVDRVFVSLDGMKRELQRARQPPQRIRVHHHRDIDIIP